MRAGDHTAVHRAAGLPLVQHLQIADENIFGSFVGARGAVIELRILQNQRGHDKRVQDRPGNVRVRRTGDGHQDQDAGAALLTVATGREQGIPDKRFEVALRAWRQRPIATDRHRPDKEIIRGNAMVEIEIEPEVHFPSQAATTALEIRAV